jgi:hypothetical protein
VVERRAGGDGGGRVAAAAAGGRAGSCCWRGWRRALVQLLMGVVVPDVGLSQQGRGARVVRVRCCMPGSPGRCDSPTTARVHRVRNRVCA